MLITAMLVAVALDAAAPADAARFWAQALRWTILDRGDAGVELVPTDGTSVRLLVRPRAYEKVGQNRIHFDLFNCDGTRELGCFYGDGNQLCLVES